MQVQGDGAEDEVSPRFRGGRNITLKAPPHHVNGCWVSMPAAI